MLTYSVFDAKTHISAILDKIEAGEEVVITRHKKPVAHLRRYQDTKAQVKRAHAIDALIKLRDDLNMDGSDWREAIEEGRQ
ncbi:MAG: type II toxin-antitoxin system Phd/YefM family antitoxin [Thalassospira sp.]|nr:type II toxin-antitoxin system Phd/YefM family antitoxin [Thalassospira sp.]